MSAPPVTDRRRRPRWSLPALATAALVIVGVSAGAYGLLPGEPVVVRLEMAALVLTLGMWVFLFLALYHGLRLNPRERLRINWPRKSEVTPAEWMDTGWQFTSAGAEQGVAGAVAGLLLDLLISFLLCVVVTVVWWLGLNVVLGAVLLVGLPALYLFARSVRQVLARGRRCRGRWGWSLVGATVGAVVYTVWLHGLIWAGLALRERGADVLR